MRRGPLLGSLIFFLLGPGLEAGLGPLLLTGGFSVGDGLPRSAALRGAGALLVLAGLAVLVEAFARFAREGAGTPSPAAPTQALVVGGAYRHVRNPMYVATVAVIAGEALLLRQPILLAGALVYVLALGALGHFREEPLLRERFGGAYDAYRAAVPAWVPRLRPWRG